MQGIYDVENNLFTTEHCSMQTCLTLPLLYGIAYLLSNIYDKQLFCLIQVICPTIILFNCKNALQNCHFWWSTSFANCNSHSSQISITTELSIHFYFIASFSRIRANRRGWKIHLSCFYAMTKLLEAPPTST